MSASNLYNTSNNKKLVDVLNSKLKGKKILHLGSLAGWPYTLAKAMKDLGINSENVIHCYKDVAGLKRNLSFDRAIYKQSDNPLTKLQKTLSFFAESLDQYGLIHYHSSNIFPRELHWLYEGPAIRRANIPMVLSLGGGDARFIGYTRRNNKYFYRKENKIKDLDTALRWMSWSKNIDLCATDPEMMVFANKFISKTHYFKQPIDYSRLPKRITNAGKILKFLHIPTEPWVKGTDTINATMKKLSDDGYEFVYETVRNLTQDECYKKFNECDVYIDELKCGSHGVTAVEAMALGKAVITYIRDDLIAQYPKELPIINSNPETFYSTILSIIENKIDARFVGEQSYKYALNNHESKAVSLELFRAYIDLFE